MPSRTSSPQPDQAEPDAGAEHQPTDPDEDVVHFHRDEPSDSDDEPADRCEAPTDGYERVQGVRGWRIPVRDRRWSWVRCPHVSPGRWRVRRRCAIGRGGHGPPSPGPSWTFRADVVRRRPGNTLIIVRPVIPPGRWGP